MHSSSLILLYLQAIEEFLAWSGIIARRAERQVGLRSVRLSMWLVALPR